MLMALPCWHKTQANVEYGEKPGNRFRVPPLKKGEKLAIFGGGPAKLKEVGRKEKR